MRRPERRSRPRTPSRSRKAACRRAPAAAKRRRAARLLAANARRRLAAQPLGVGMPADNARRRAGNVEQDAVERPAVPPAPARRRRPRPRARAAPRGAAARGCRGCERAASRRLSSAMRSTSASSSEVRRLPPGAAQASSTRMPSATSSNGAASCAPRSWTENAPCVEARQLVDRPRIRDDHPRLPAALAAMRRGTHVARSAFRVHNAPIGAQRSGGRDCPLRESTCHVIRVVAPHARDPPLRVRPARDRVVAHRLLQRARSRR